ncbi:hypothetical protein [Thiorhodovibrio winogradskyi]|uniref:hypothetical protein n=1 Tax=Thiorhodovibrio winogradskyi TaxID=77007 RepID=UPI001A910D4A|nr:hypothetical protein [Thiorhodovibrio winogradskyi]
MNTLSIDYPESLPAVLNLSPLEFERDARIALAAKFLSRSAFSTRKQASWNASLCASGVSIRLMSTAVTFP